MYKTCIYISDTCITPFSYQTTPKCIGGSLVVEVGVCVCCAFTILHLNNFMFQVSSKMDVHTSRVIGPEHGEGEKQHGIQLLSNSEKVKRKLVLSITNLDQFLKN